MGAGFSCHDLCGGLLSHLYDSWRSCAFFPFFRVDCPRNCRTIHAEPDPKSPRKKPSPDTSRRAGATGFFAGRALEKRGSGPVPSGCSKHDRRYRKNAPRETPLLAGGGSLSLPLPDGTVTYNGTYCGHSKRGAVPPAFDAGSSRSLGSPLAPSLCRAFLLSGDASLGSRDHAHGGSSVRSSCADRDRSPVIYRSRADVGPAACGRDSRDDGRSPFPDFYPAQRPGMVRHGSLQLYLSDACFGGALWELAPVSEVFCPWRRDSGIFNGALRALLDRMAVYPGADPRLSSDKSGRSCVLSSIPINRDD